MRTRSPFSGARRAVPLALVTAACSTASPEPQPAAPAVPPAAETGPKTVEKTLAEVGLDASALDRSVDPCTDFYAFACGGWLEKTQIPADKSRWVRSFNEIHQRNEQALKAILEEAAAGESDDPAVQKIGAYYRACMDAAKVDEAGMAPLQPLLAAVKKARNARTLAPVLGELHRHRVWAFFSLGALQDFQDATSVIAYLDQAGLGLPERDYYLNEEDEKKMELRAAYVAHVERMMALSGFPARRAKRAAADVLRVETALARVSKSPVERRNPVEMYNKLDLEGVKEAAPRFPWARYLESLGKPDLVDINVTAPKFVEGMNALLAETQTRALQHYLRWHVLRTYAPALSQPFFDESFAFKKALTGQDEPQPRWKRCIASTDDALGELLAQPFVEAKFAGESKSAAEAYVQGIRDAFDRNLDRLDWMDDATKTRAREKLSKFTYLIGYPSKWKAYGFEVGEVHAKNLVAAQAFETARDLARIGGPVDRERWEMTPPTVNAYYHPLKNQMVFPAGILQPPFYAVDAHVPVNLGAMGMVVGHELTHGFDDQGSQFDGDGNLKKWWTDESRSAFEGLTQCVVDQYEGYEVVEGVHLNGKLTLGENIADLGGLKLAFDAYRTMREDADEVWVAEGFTEDQQFFLANAQVWCAKAKEAETRRRAQIDPHSAPRFRVNGPMANLSAFAEAFQCAPGTPMNPEKTCGVW